MKLDWLQEYCRNCDAGKECRYDSFMNHANEMLKMNQLPDEFEGNKEWIELGTKHT